MKELIKKLLRETLSNYYRTTQDLIIQQKENLNQGVWRIPYNEISDVQFIKTNLLRRNDGEISDDSNINKIVSIIKQNKPLPPIVIDIYNKILDGHHRFEAAKLLRVDEVPVLIVGRKDSINENLDYQGEHQAPDKDDIPIYDMTKGYPDDIYSSDAVRMYGEHSDEYSDQYSLTVINSVRNKPKAKVKIYRAVPNANHDISKQIKELSDIVSYYYKFGFFPMKNKIVNNLDDKYYNEIPDYGERQAKMLTDIKSEITKLESSKIKGLGINSGDWVTINPDYAKSHGKNNLNNKFKVITKTVPASTLFTYGDSIHEWGYNT